MASRQTCINIVEDTAHESGVFTPQQYKAVGNGVADDTTAIQACFAAAIAAQGIVDLGSHTYKTSAPVALTAPVTVRSPYSGQITNSTSDLFTVSTGANNVVFDGVTLVSRSGGGHIFNAGTSSVSGWRITGCTISQVNAAKSGWYQSDGGFINQTVRDCITQHTLSATVPFWDITSSLGGIEVNVWENIRHTYTGNYCWRLRSTSATSYMQGNVIQAITAEVCNGGIIYMQAGRGDRIQQITSFDNTSELVGVDMISFQKNSSNLVCWGEVVDQYLRLDGTLAENVVDIRLGTSSFARGTIKSSGGQIDCGNNSSLLLEELYYGAPGAMQAVVTNQAATVPVVSSVAGNTFLPGISVTAPWIPADSGLLVANMDPLFATGASSMVAGVVYLQKLVARQAMTLTDLVYYVNTAASGTSSGSFVGLYSSAGALLSGSADIETYLLGTGMKAIALTTPQPLTAGQVVWAAIVENMSGTQPKLQCNGVSSGVSNINLTAAHYRFANYATGSQVALPPSITPASELIAPTTLPWVAGL